MLVKKKKWTTAAERHWVTKNKTKQKTEELSQTIYYKDVLTSLWWNPAVVLRWRHGYVYVSRGTEKIWLPTKLIKIRSYQGKPLISWDMNVFTNSPGDSLSVFITNFSKTYVQTNFKRANPNDRSQGLDRIQRLDRQHRVLTNNTDLRDNTETG